MKKFIIALSLIWLCACKKTDTHQAEDKTTVTYTFYSDSIPYHVAIWDITNLHDFSDSAKTNTFVKTIVYDYNETFRSAINCKSVSFKTISIVKGSDTSKCTDSMYKSLDCFINI